MSVFEGGEGRVGNEEKEDMRVSTTMKNHSISARENTYFGECLEVGVGCIEERLVEL